MNNTLVDYSTGRRNTFSEMSAYHLRHHSIGKVGNSDDVDTSRSQCRPWLINLFVFSKLRSFSWLDGQAGNTPIVYVKLVKSLLPMSYHILKTVMRILLL